MKVRFASAIILLAACPEAAGRRTSVYVEYLLAAVGPDVPDGATRLPMIITDVDGWPTPELRCLKCRCCRDRKPADASEGAANGVGPKGGGQRWFPERRQNVVTGVFMPMR